MEILIGLFVGITIIGILLAIFEWVRLGMPFGKRMPRRPKTSRQVPKELDALNGDNQR